jgi:hypothetical protein
MSDKRGVHVFFAERARFSELAPEMEFAYCKPLKVILSQDSIYRTRSAPFRLTSAVGKITISFHFFARKMKLPFLYSNFFTSNETRTFVTL